MKTGSVYGWGKGSRDSDRIQHIGYLKCQLAWIKGHPDSLRNSVSVRVFTEELAFELVH